MQAMHDYVRLNLVLCDLVGFHIQFNHSLGAGIKLNQNSIIFFGFRKEIHSNHFGMNLKWILMRKLSTILGIRFRTLTRETSGRESKVLF